MIVREVDPSEHKAYNSVVHHPLQSWEWGEFRKQTGHKIKRLGLYENGIIRNGFQVSFHSIPHFSQPVGYCPRGYTPDTQQLTALQEIAQKEKALFIKLEPNVAQPISQSSELDPLKKLLEKHDAVPGRPLFTKYSFQLDLTQSEEDILRNMTSKTRYNASLASRKGVTIRENTSKEGMDQYIEILEETTSRQGFYAHDAQYFHTMWDSIGQSGMLRIFEAVYQEKVLVSWIMFVFNGVLYYPYGSSRNIHREVMASNLMMWEMIRFGQNTGCHLFDMWGSLGPEPNENDPWYGFHKFKKGYGGELVEFLGTYDVVYNQPMYSIFTVANNLRWKWLRFKAKIRL